MCTALDRNSQNDTLDFDTLVGQAWCTLALYCWITRMDNNDVSEDFAGFPNYMAIELAQAMLRRFHELTMEQIEKDIIEAEKDASVRSLELRAYWSKYADLQLASWKRMEDYKHPVRSLDLVLQLFGDQIGVPSSRLPHDVEARLAWFKSRIGKDFELRVRADMDARNVQSPIEQIFLMQWHYLEMSERHGLVLEPQHRVQVGQQEFRIDFLVKNPSGNVQLAIELDGHEFHEKTREQATRDRKRERQITAQGFTVLRFTGYEIVRDVGRCVDEVVEFALSR